MDGELYGALLYLALFGSVIAFGAWALVGRIYPGKAAWYPAVPAGSSPSPRVYEGYVWQRSAGSRRPVSGNMVMFETRETLQFPTLTNGIKKGCITQAVFINLLMNIKHGWRPLPCHPNLLQRAEAHWRIFVVSASCIATFITGLLVAASISSPSKNRCVSMVRCPVAICVPATTSATGTTS